MHANSSRPSCVRAHRARRRSVEPPLSLRDDPPAGAAHSQRLRARPTAR